MMTLDDSAPAFENCECRVLLVEDNFFAAVHLRSLLESMGCEVIGPAPSLEEGLELAKKESLTGAILDINIIGGTSVDIAAQLERKGTPFFFVTGYSSPSTLPEEMHRHTRLNKPLDSGQLKATVLREFARGQN